MASERRAHDSDHRRAARLAHALADHPAFEIDPEAVRTNILVANLRDPWTSEGALAQLEGLGVRAGTMGPGRIRFVTHLDVDDDAIDRAIGAVGRLTAG